MRKVVVRLTALITLGLIALSGCSRSAATESAASSRPVSSGANKAAASSAGSSFTGQRVSVQYGVQASIPNAPILVPADTGVYAAQGLDVSTQIFTDTVQIMLAVGKGQLQMGNITMGAAAFNALNRGLDLKIVASSVQDPPGHGSVVPIIARADLYDSGALRTPAQLKGRKLAINAKGTVLEYALAKLMARADLKPTDLDLIVMPFADMLTAFGNKSLDAAVMLEPTGTTAIVKGLGKLLSDDHMAGAQVAMVTANAQFATENPDAVQRFLHVYLNTIRRFDDGGLKRDDQALSILQKYTNVPPEITRQVPDAYWPKDGRLNLASLEDQQDYYLQNKSVDYAQPIPLNKFIDYSYLDADFGQISR